MSYKAPDTKDGSIQATFAGELLERLKKVCEVLNVKPQDYIREATAIRIAHHEDTLPELMTREQLIELIRSNNLLDRRVSTAPVQQVLFDDNPETDDEPTESDSPLCVTLKELSNRAGLPYSRVWSLAKMGMIPSLPRVDGGPYRFVLNDALKAIRELTNAPEVGE